MKSSGKLYIVATPIGNLEDLTLRALKTLKEVNYIACEDTRHTKKLLNKYRIKKNLISYFHPKEKEKIPKIIKILEEGNNVALVSDAGTPGLSDPGFPLIKKALEYRIRVIPIPGPSALTAALSAAGLPTERFLFLGFPPSKKEATRKLFQSINDEKATLVFYLPPRKLHSFLMLIKETLGNRDIVIARELTKIHEEFLRGKPDELKEILQEKRLKGEATVLIKGSHKGGK